jgi:hypothetical protein
MKWLLVSYLLGADFNEAQPSPEPKNGTLKSSGEFAMNK